MNTPEFLEVVIERRTVAADAIIVLELSAASGTSLPGFAAGAHVDVHVEPGLIRQYSLCNDPARLDHYRLGILRETASRGGSAAIHDRFAPGQRLRIGTPRNNFPLLEAARTTVLVAGGIGITPLLAMAYRLQTIGADFELHYCVRSRARAAFLEELQQSPFAQRVRLYVDDGPEEQRFVPSKCLPAPHVGAHLYACGPGGFMSYVTAETERLGWSAGNVHLEYFNANVDTSGDRFSVQAARSGLTVEVPADKTIAEVLAQHGVAVPLSCQQGVCGTCLTPVLQGVPEHRDMFQTDQEQAANTHITICCSRSKSPLLVLDI